MVIVQRFVHICWTLSSDAFCKAVCKKVFHLTHSVQNSKYNWCVLVLTYCYGPTP